MIFDMSVESRLFTPVIRFQRSSGSPVVWVVWVLALYFNHAMGLLHRKFYTLSCLFGRTYRTDVNYVTWDGCLGLTTSSVWLTRTGYFTCMVV